MPNESKIVLANKEHGTTTEIIDNNENSVNRKFCLPDLDGELVVRRPSMEIEIGPNEKIKTINEGINYVDKVLPSLVMSDGKVIGENDFRLILKDNFILDEQVHIYQRDLSHISIEAETKGRVITATTRCLKKPGGGFGQYSYSSHRAYFYFKYSKSPYFGIKFRPDAVWDLTNSSSPTGIDGITVGSVFGFHWDNASTGLLMPGAGIENIFWGSFAANSSIVSLTGSEYMDCTHAITSDNSSIINAQFSKVKNNLGNAYWAAENSKIDAESSLIDNSMVGCLVSQNSSINMGSSKFTNMKSNSFCFTMNSGSISAFSLFYNNLNNQGQMMPSSLVGNENTKNGRITYSIRP